MHPGAFRGTKNLTELKIESRSLFHLPSLCHISHSLEYLVIAYSGHIVYSADYLSPCHVLQRVTIIWTNLANLRLGLRNVADSVQNLKLRGNKLTSLSDIHDINFVKLKCLDLLNNFISNVNPRKLLFPALKYLNLDYNRIKYIEDPSPFGWGSALPNGSFAIVRIALNPWNCSKPFTWLTQGVLFQDATAVFLSYRRDPHKVIIYKILGMTCYIPHAMHGLPVIPDDVINNALMGRDPAQRVTGKATRPCRLTHNFRAHQFSMQNFLLCYLIHIIVWMKICFFLLSKRKQYLIRRPTAPVDYVSTKLPI